MKYLLIAILTVLNLVFVSGNVIQPVSEETNPVVIKEEPPKDESPVELPPSDPPGILARRPLILPWYPRPEPELTFPWPEPTFPWQEPTYPWQEPTYPWPGQYPYTRPYPLPKPYNIPFDPNPDFWR